MGVDAGVVTLALAAVALGQLVLQRLEFLLLLRFLDHDEFLVGELAGHRAVEIGQQDQAGGDAEDDADAIEPAS